VGGQVWGLRTTNTLNHRYANLGPGRGLISDTRYDLNTTQHWCRGKSQSPWWEVVRFSVSHSPREGPMQEDIGMTAQYSQIREEGSGKDGCDKPLVINIQDHPCTS